MGNIALRVQSRPLASTYFVNEQPDKRTIRIRRFTNRMIKNIAQFQEYVKSYKKSLLARTLKTIVKCSVRLPKKERIDGRIKPGITIPPRPGCNLKANSVVVLT